LKTVFGEAHFSVPRQKCQDCQQTFSVSTPLLEATHPLDDSNVTQALRKIAILCGSSWPFRQAANVLRELTGVKLSFGHIRWLCADEAKVARAEFDEKYDQIEWEALVETMEVLVEYLADEPKETTKEPTNTSADADSSPKRVYTGIDGTFINAVEAKRFIEAKAAIVFTDDRKKVSKGRNLLLNKQYVGSCQPVKEFGEKLFCCARDFGINDQTEHIILADGARWITKLAKTQYPLAKLILDWWHLNKRVWETVDWLKHHGLSAKDARNWGQRVRDWLWRGKAIVALQYCVSLGKQMGLSPPEDKPQTQLGETSLQSFYLYLNNNFDSIIDYHRYRRNGYFISSVFVEKTIDLLICRRLKLRGQNWSRKGADNIVTFRQMIQNNDWKDYWQGQKAA